MRWTWSALTPFFDESMRNATLNHARSGTIVFSKLVPAGRRPRQSRAAPPAAAPSREAIVDAAERLFSARGVDGVAVRDLAREMGLTPSSLYNHFSGKQALYEAVLERGLRPIVDLLAAAPSGVLGPAQLAATIERLIRHLAVHPHLARLLQRALLEDGQLQAAIGRWA